jgi:hypothetical protein
MLVIFLILMCTASFTLHDTMNVTVHNQYSDIELVSLVYFCKCETYNEYSIERMSTDSIMKIGFRFDLEQDEPGGILMYEVQRDTKSDRQSSIDPISAKVIKDTSKMIRLLVAWRFERPWTIRARIALTEHDNELVLNEDKLAQLYDKIYDIPSEVYNLFFRYDGIYKSTWLICNNTVLKEADEVIFEKGIELKITISEGVEDKYTVKPLWIDSTRQVLSLMVIYFTLIYIISFIIQSTIDLSVDNQCANVELVSPVYFAKEAISHIHLSQQVNSNSRMKVKFKTGIDRDTFGGILLYHLQRKEDASISTQLLVIWGYNSDGVYSHVRLIKHESTLIWNEDKLKMLYDGYSTLYDNYYKMRGWLLDDNTKLKTKCEISHGGFEMNIIISEEKGLTLFIKPLWVDSNR